MEHLTGVLTACVCMHTCRHTHMHSHARTHMKYLTGVHTACVCMHARTHTHTVVTLPLPRAVGACIVNRTDELKESDVGTECGLFEIRKIGDEYFTFLVECKSPKACTILLRGASKDILNEVWGGGEGEGGGVEER